MHAYKYQCWRKIKDSWIRLLDEVACLERPLHYSNLFRHFSIFHIKAYLKAGLRFQLDLFGYWKVKSTLKLTNEKFFRLRSFGLKMITFGSLHNQRLKGIINCLPVTQQKIQARPKSRLDLNISISSQNEDLFILPVRNAF